VKVLNQWQKLLSKRRLGIIDRFAQDSSLFFALLGFLPLPALIDLYSISREFHKAFNHHATASILASANTWSPNAQHIFPWTSYLNLCVKDPIQRQQARRQNPHAPVTAGPSNGADHTMEGPAQDQLAVFRNSRDVPSLRWLQMVAWRHGIAQDIVDLLNSKACYLTPDSVDVIKVSPFPPSSARHVHDGSSVSSF
jgi:hypothetical protein